MTLERKKVLRYGVALDAVVLVTGVALNFSDIPALVIVAMFTAAVAIGAWRGGWGPALAGLGLALVSALVFFRAGMPAAMLALLALSGVGGAWVGVSVRRGSLNSESIIPAGDVEPLQLLDPASLDRAEDDAASRDFLRDEELHVMTQPEKPPAVAPSVELPSSMASAPSEDEESKRLLEDRLAANRALIEEALNERVERQGQSDRMLFSRRAAERLAIEREQAEREFQKRLTTERAAIQSRLAEQLATERAAMEREAALRLEQEKRVVQESIARQFDSDRAALTKRPASAMVPSPSDPVVPSPVTSESLVEPSDADSPSLAGSALRTAPATGAPQIQTQAQTQTGPPPFAGDPQTIMTARGPVPKRPLSKTPARPEPVGLFGSLWSSASGLFGRRIGSRASVNLRSRGPTPPPRVTAASKSPAPAEPRRPRLLLIERRRAMADTVLPELRKRGIDAEVVERWIDAIDEMFRFMPDALLVDIEIPEYERLLESLTGPSSALPVFLTGRNRPSAGQVERIPNAGFLTRPYDADELERAAQQFSHRSRAGVRRIAVPLPTLEPDEPGEGDLAPIPLAEDAGMTEPARPSIPIPSAEPRQFPSADRHEAPVVAVADAADYIVECFNCGGIYDAMEAEWCSCLTRERSLVCASCLTCFCKAPPAYKERFWLEAPASLFERKTAEKRHESPAPNPSPDFVTRPLVLLAEDDEDTLLIVQRVAADLGYGFIAASNGQDGLSLARLYKPDLILSDAFMPKLDGREMCRTLRDEPGFEQCHMVVMTGLYTDTKYKSEALSRFKVDEYLAKPVAINELVALLQKYLDGHEVKITTQPLPAPEVAKAQPQVTINELDEWPEESIALSELMADSEQNADEVGFEVLASTAPPLQLPELRLEMASTESLPQPEAAPEQTTYEVCCFSCAELFDAAHAEWCTCLGRDQTLVCPECGNCFCKAPSLYKERFWMDAPSILFERKTLGSRRTPTSSESLSPDDVKRPLILLVEDDENIQLIVRTVVTTLGYGFVVAADGQAGLALARRYKPELVLSDAFMPKLDGREMCRLLKADPATAHAKAIVMTGLYTDRKSRNEAFDYFNVDDYVAKPLAVGDLIKLLRKHLPAEVQPTM